MLTFDVNLLLITISKIYNNTIHSCQFD